MGVIAVSEASRVSSLSMKISTGMRWTRAPMARACSMNRP